MRVGSFGGALLLGASLIAGGCATAPAASDHGSAPASAAASGQPSSSAAPRPSPSPASSAVAASIEPIGSGSPGPSAEPVVLSAAGTTTADITAGAMMFVPQDGGRAICRSRPDSQEVADITALDLGELGPGSLRATIGLEGRAAELFIDGGDLPDGSFQPFWTGPVLIARHPAVGAPGTVTFHDLDLEADAGSKPGQSPLPGATAWPGVLSGTISWSCGPWDETTPSGAPPA